MDLPLDHFRLLGVSPATDAQTVLRTLQLRLDRPPDQGYTVDTLQARADLLRDSADLLSDEERRRAYESDLTALAAAQEPLMPALEIPSSREVAGLLLLLEAGQPVEAFHLASRALQPPQAPALGSGREADLALLAGEAALAAAADQGQERHYELAARTLQQGLQLLQRMGQLPELRLRIHAELDALAPFRVLDLLSRDPAASQERKEGLELLEQLVQRRGGLEGEQDETFALEDFQTFFKQIRGFLTVQEQLDLFQRWGGQGSQAAAFLGTIALTASGFAQRKPERIANARQQLLASGREGTQPLIANLDLLLGDVEGAIQRFSDGSGPELRAWAERQSSDPLAQVCAWCRDWLSRDVLPGYRDLDADADLEAYFSDRDVLAWVEREDRRSGRSFSTASSTGLASAADATQSWPEPAGWSAPPGLQSDLLGAIGLESGPGASSAAPPQPSRRRHRSQQTEDQEGGLGRLLPAGGWMDPGSWPRRSQFVAAAGLLAAFLGGFWLLRAAPWRHQPLTTDSSATRTLPSAAQPAPPPGPSTTPAKPTTPQSAQMVPQSTTSAPAVATSLSSADPSEAELTELLERWLKAKTSVLAGEAAPADLDQLARPVMVDQLDRQRAGDQAAGRRQSIEVAIGKATVQDRSPRRIALQADLSYRDTTTDASGKVIARTAPTTLRNVYVFGRDADAWRLAASRPAP
ncbi:MAG: IMS domain-containing protein [Cyanobium sp.]